ncbi:hypothetical protein [Constantimarinum furrinae]|uniref:Uncharacterized protein n=1 Tax=Constantimarinum furrinae TaxID=2562285 RepID=A0A7G8PXR4_9FLAO|nr:hypothetical protein [Constantimarinum furrinae]QNJ99130.1 hypothetical protein ALE3EI_2601 [Constantimarinum furrinae]
MKTNAFNICPSCIHRDICVLTTQKSRVWSCSEYDEELSEDSHLELIMSSDLKTKQQTVTVLA